MKMISLILKFATLLPSALVWRTIYGVEFLLHGAMRVTGYAPRKFDHRANHISIDRDVVTSVNDSASLLLVTMTKSGTHWLGYLISNYLAALNNDNALHAMSNQELFQKCFNTPRNGVLWLGAKVSEPSVDTSPLGVKRLMQQHPVSAKNNAIFFTGYRVCIYRNPRDWLVSAHAYNLKRQDSHYLPKTPRAAIHFLMPQFCEQMLSILALQQGGMDMILSYEDLIENTPYQLERIIHHVGATPNPEALAFSLKKSSAASTRTQNRNIGGISASAFVRDARLGQWKDVFSKSDISAINAYLDKACIDQSLFTYDTASA